MDSIDVHIHEGEQQAPPEDPLRKQLHSMWSAVAEGWDANADFIEATRSPVSDAMLDFARAQPGERVLELACGPGGPGFIAARQVGDDGELVCSDFSAEMVAVAAKRAQALGLHNVMTKVLDIEQIDEPDESFDVVFCREGLMLVPDPELGAREIRRVLHPGGRAALSVWGPRERNPWLGLLFDAVSDEIGAPIPPPGVPQPFSLDSVAKLEAVLAGAGFSEMHVNEMEIVHRAPSVDDWWQRTTAIAGPLAQVLAALPPEKIDAIRAGAESAVSAYAAQDGIELPSVSLVATLRVA